MTLLDACAEAGVEAFVYTGSSSEYGYKDHPPREDEMLEPNSHYAITKAAATHYCQFVAVQHDINAIAVRLYSIYGPFEDPSRLMPTLIDHGLRGTLPPLVSPDHRPRFRLRGRCCRRPASASPKALPGAEPSTTCVPECKPASPR